MKVILLAGGKGTRISKEINDLPKCTLNIGNDIPLIRYTVQLFLKNKIEVAVVLGFKKQMVIDSLKGLDVQFFYNPFYSVTNSIASLWFARDFWSIDEDVLIMNADVYLEQNSIDLMLKDKRSPIMLVDPSRKEQGDYFFKYENEILSKYGKELPLEERTGEYIGVAKMNKDFRKIFLEQMEIMISSEMYDKWWENVLYSLSDKGVPIYVSEMNFFWSEIDNILDYQNIISYIKNKN